MERKLTKDDLVAARRKVTYAEVALDAISSTNVAGKTQEQMVDIELESLKRQDDYQRSLHEYRTLLQRYYEQAASPKEVVIEEFEQGRKRMAASAAEEADKFEGKGKI